jgi:hypothetical protein
MPLPSVRLREDGPEISYVQDMRSAVHPRGRLPARVYWFRRLMVVLTAFALVFAIGRMLNGSGSPPDATATVTGAHPSTSPSATVSQATVGPQPIQATTGKTAHPTATGTPVVLAEPTGPCAADEISVAPTVPEPVAGSGVRLVLELTGIRPACTFVVSNRTIVAKVISGNDRIWSSQDCPASVRPSSVVVRSAVPAKVVVHWSGRRSDDECSRSTAWALPGYYHLVAAVIGSEPGDEQFRLTRPPRPIVTKTAHPKKTQHAD